MGTPMKMGRKNMKIARAAHSVLAACLASGLAVETATAANITWDGPTSGTVNWDDPNNWSGSSTPGTSDHAFVTDELTGDRTIITPEGNYTIDRLDWIHQDVDFINTLQLGGNLTVAGSDTGTFNNRAYFQNQTGDASKFVVDLNGHTLAFPDWVNINTGNNPDGSPRTSIFATPVSFTTSNGPATIELRDHRQFAVQTNIGADVTVRTSGDQSGKTFVAGNWDINSTYHYANTPGTGNPTAALFPWNGLGHFILGDDTNSSRSVMSVRYGHSQSSDEVFRIRNSFTIHPSTNPNSPSTLRFTTNANHADPHIWVGGDYHDYVSGNHDYEYQDGTRYLVNLLDGGHITFQGNPNTARVVHIERTGITATNFNVGVDSDNVGNIVLTHNLSTEATFAVREGSTLDINDKTIVAGEFVGESGINLSYTIGSGASGLIELIATDFTNNTLGEETIITNGTRHGDVTLNDFVLNITHDGTWNDGDTLVLMTYEGTLSGTPNLLLGDLPAEGFSYDQFLTDNGEVRLTNVVIPEPASLGLLVVGGLLTLSGRRRPMRS
ncbi:PEP-CTERM sorting domain-containing protein [Phycisphaerales bacterium AB-hyl4]|uniref:PEP-CTERM sorting domain-containing protein n=1 Tax=Natronomicrosphaera hydrolytica TaxID=3242702 RepID=A0ABV4U582_9BACT